MGKYSIKKNIEKYFIPKQKIIDKEKNLRNIFLIVKTNIFSKYYKYNGIVKFYSGGKITEKTLFEEIF